MGDVSIIARRSKSGKVQYGWSGNGGYFENLGRMLLEWYNTRKMVDYLFRYGRQGMIMHPNELKKIGVEYLNRRIFGKKWFTVSSEHKIFDEILFIDHVYFYDINDRWYYVLTDNFLTKVPLEYFGLRFINNKGEFNSFDECVRIDKMIAKCILEEWYSFNECFQSYVCEHYPQGIESIKQDVYITEDYPCRRLREKYHLIYEWFDDWTVVNTDESNTKIESIVLHPKQDEDNRVETIDWQIY